MQIYYEFFISATISSPNMTRDSNELKVQLISGVWQYLRPLCIHLNKLLIKMIFKGGQKSLGQLLKTFPKQRKDILRPGLVDHSCNNSGMYTDPPLPAPTMLLKTVNRQCTQRTKLKTVWG